MDQKSDFFSKKGADPNLQLRIKTVRAETFFEHPFFKFFGVPFGTFLAKVGTFGSHFGAPGGHFGAPGTILETIFDDFLCFFNS